MSLISRPAAHWRALTERCGRPASRVLAACAVLLALLVVYLLVAEKPWSGEIRKRLAAGKELKLEHFITIGTWWGAAAGAVLLAGCLAVQRWWREPVGGVFPAPVETSRIPRFLLVFYFVSAFLLAAWPRAARLDHSLWNDESMHLRYYVWGGYTPDDEGSLTFHPVDWKHALFQNEKGNNHVWSSGEVRLGHLLGGGNWGPDSTFREPALRMFPFVSGLATVCMVVLLGVAMGAPRAGLAAGLLMALHPWHVRWGVEIRGYSTMLLAITTGLLCLLRALETNRWRWWLGFAGCQALFLLCFSGSLYVAAAQNLVALACIWRSGAPVAERRSAALRLVAVAGALSAVPVCFLMGPSVPQIAAYLATEHHYAPVGTGWLLDLWSHLCTGLRAGGDPPGTNNGLGLDQLVAEAPWRGWIVRIILPVIVSGGLIALLVQSWRTRLVAGTLLLAGILAVAHNAVAHTAMMTWYVLYLIPLFVLSIAWAGHALARFSPRTFRSAPLLVAALAVLLAAPGLTRIITVPRQPIREAVAAMRRASPALRGADPGIVTASFGDAARQMLPYDPRLRLLKTPADFTALSAEAAAAPEGAPYFLCFQNRFYLETREPEILEAVLADRRWQKLSDVYGMEAIWSYEIFQFLPDEIVVPLRLTAPPAENP